jgi:FkbM family methyltransferase
MVKLFRAKSFKVDFVKLRRYISLSYLRRAKEILKTQYRGLLFHDDLNYEWKNVRSPEIVLTSQDNDWKILEISGERYYWPVEYGATGLRGLHKEVFAPSRSNPHAYETRNVKISPFDWVIDAGASEGFFVRYALQRQAKVLAIEPLPKLAESLRKTFQQEIRAGNVIVLNMGLGASPGISRIKIDQDQIYCSTVSSQEGEVIDIITIDEILKRKIIPTVNFIKMDIEGWECDAILGAAETLQKLRPKLSIAVYHEYWNAQKIRKTIRKKQPLYRVMFRGIFIRQQFGAPRPYMLHAL